MLAGPGTPRDPKSDVFVTKWVAIQPFGTFYARLDAEFRPGARQIGPTPSISTFFSTNSGPKIWKSPNFEHAFAVFLSQAALEGFPHPHNLKKCFFGPGFRVFFLSKAALEGFRLKKSDFLMGVRVFFLSKAALEGLAGPPRALGALGGPGRPWGALGGPGGPISPHFPPSPLSPPDSL